MASDRKKLTASDFGQYGRCAKQIQMDGKYGIKRSSEWKQRAVRGIKTHKTYERRAIRTQPVLAGRRECYIATALYGPDAPETNFLREWRDANLIHSKSGRICIAVYYTLSPTLVKLIPKNSVVEKALRILGRALLKKLKGADQ